MRKWRATELSRRKEEEKEDAEEEEEEEASAYIKVGRKHRSCRWGLKKATMIAKLRGGIKCSFAEQRHLGR